jgi:biopolymer transport protein ExbD
MRFTKRQRPPVPAIDMTPMIDVVFLLLVFFMTVSQISEVRRAQLDLPALKSDNEQSPTQFTVNLDAQGALFVGGDPVSIAQLRQLLVQQFGKGNPQGEAVVVRADRTCNSRFVNEVITDMAREGIRVVRIAVQDPQ